MSVTHLPRSTLEGKVLLVQGTGDLFWDALRCLIVVTAALVATGSRVAQVGNQPEALPEICAATTASSGVTHQQLYIRLRTVLPSCVHSEGLVGRECGSTVAREARETRGRENSRIRRGAHVFIKQRVYERALPYDTIPPLGLLRDQLQPLGDNCRRRKCGRHRFTSNTMSAETCF